MSKESSPQGMLLLKAMPGITLPDYDAGSIANVAASLASGMGAPDIGLAPLTGLAPDRISVYRNVVLLVVDGMGWQFLRDRAPASYLAANLRQPITSVFPSTTATAITSLTTALTPQQHAITGWYMYLQDIDDIAAILPFKARGQSVFPDQPRYDPIKHYRFNPVMAKLPRRKFVINDSRIVDSAYSLATSGNAARLAYHSMAGMLHSIESVIRSSAEDKFIYAYWPEFDAICHAHGSASNEAREHFHLLDQQFEAMVRDLAGENTLIVVTADHGFIDTDAEHLLALEAHPQLQAMLRMPLCGEPRAAYCYLRPGSEQAFESYVEEHLSHVCLAASRDRLLASGVFGRGELHADFSSRVGDYILLARENWVIKDTLEGEQPFTQIGVHGGLSSAEMQVPLIVVDCQASA